MVKKDIDWLKLIRGNAKKKNLYSNHAITQMNSEERLITTDEVKDVIENGQIIETRLNDPRGKTFLLNGRTQNKRYVHVVCSPKEEFTVIVTAYVPNKEDWTDDFSKRVKS